MINMCTCIGVASCDVKQLTAPVATSVSCFGAALSCVVNYALNTYVPGAFPDDRNVCIAWSVGVAKDYAAYYAATDKSTTALVSTCNSTTCQVIYNSYTQATDLSPACAFTTVTSAPTYVAGSMNQYTCPDGTTSKNIVSCACVANANVSGLGATFKRSLSATNTFDASAPLSVFAYATYQVASGNCSGFDFTPFLSFAWSLTNSSYGVVDQSMSSAFFVAPASLSVNQWYVLTLKATDLTGVNTTKSWNFTAIAPPPVIVFDQGSSIRVSNTKAVFISVTVTDSFPDTSPTSIWTCADLTNCPTLTNSTFDTLTLPVNTAAGSYSITYIYKSINTTISVGLVAQAIPSVSIVFASAPLVLSPTVYFSDKIVGLTSVVEFSGAVTYTWTVNDVTVGTSNYLNINTSTLLLTSATQVTNQQYVYNSVKVYANSSADATLYGLSVVQVVVISTYTVGLQVQKQGSLSATSAVALTDTLLLTVTPTVTAPFGTTAEFAFAFVDGLNTVPLRVTPSGSAFTALAPMPKTLGSVTFVARLRINGFDCGSVTSLFGLTAPANIDSVAAAQLAQTTSVTDASGAVNVAGNLMGLMQQSTNASLVAKMAASVVAMFVNTITDVTTLTADQQGAMMMSVAVAVSNSGSAAQKKALSIQIVNTISSAVTSSGFDVQANGPAALSALSSMDISTSASVLVDLARAVANNPNQPIGLPVTMTANNVEIVAVRQSVANLGGSSLTGSNASMSIPSGINLPGVAKNAIVSAGSTSYGTSNPFNSTGAAPTSAVVAFELSVGGQALVVSGLATPLTVTLKSSSVVVTCKYWNVTLSNWDTTGVTSQVVNGAMTCVTSHLTAFSLFDATTPAPATPAPTPRSSASSVLLSLAAAVIAVVLHVLIA